MKILNANHFCQKSQNKHFNYSQASLKAQKREQLHRARFDSGLAQKRVDFLPFYLSSQADSTNIFGFSNSTICKIVGLAGITLLGVSLFNAPQSQNLGAEPLTAQKSSELVYMKGYSNIPVVKMRDAFQSVKSFANFVNCYFYEGGLSIAQVPEKSSKISLEDAIRSVNSFTSFVELYYKKDPEEFKNKKMGDKISKITKLMEAAKAHGETSRAGKKHLRLASKILRELFDCTEGAREGSREEIQAVIYKFG